MVYFLHPQKETTVPAEEGPRARRIRDEDRMGRFAWRRLKAREDE
jgi:hypothetical protein